ncbi:sigma-70 family RNA polymerase sigma factor [Catellatospora chokoriensis]|uniref:DNA-directed RNA polymerase sigma-70 factor n=1 Tax=Catellatospora chokoriensis TaxID=310353 RepID=A0A8J3K053_9ACTN|nr:DNA-directed RNA polymerase sigma-70 factor [Catellatospora chokoriensis]
MLFPNSLTADETAQLVREAQQGHTESFTLVLRIHYAGMLAVAHRILGHGPDAEDACQDAAIMAMARIGELRDPAAVRSWLHTIVRNICINVLRSRRPVPVGVAGENEPAPETDDPVASIERAAQRDWIWQGLQRLTPATQAVTMLRYFTDNNTYEQIATLCGIPVGTVASRLSEARRQLAGILPDIRDERHDAIDALTAERRAEASTILTAVPDCIPVSKVAGRWADDVRMYWPSGRITIGLPALFATIQVNYDDGVTARLTGLVAGHGTTIWENAFVNPSHDPTHCPPQATWLLREKDAKIYEVRLIYTGNKDLRRGESQDSADHATRG